MITTEELIAAVEATGAKDADIAAVAKITPPRVSEVRNGKRNLRYEEARALVMEYGLTLQPGGAPPPRLPNEEQMTALVAATHQEVAVPPDVAEWQRAFAIELLVRLQQFAATGAIEAPPQKRSGKSPAPKRQVVRE